MLRKHDKIYAYTDECIDYTDECIEGGDSQF